jgi:hypothetical protein
MPRYTAAPYSQNIEAKINNRINTAKDAKAKKQLEHIFRPSIFGVDIPQFKSWTGVIILLLIFSLFGTIVVFGTFLKLTSRRYEAVSPAQGQGRAQAEGEELAKEGSRAQKREASQVPGQREGIMIDYRNI